MKNEAHLCSIISRSLIHGYKIPDPSNDFKNTSFRPFDGIGMVSKEIFNTNKPSFVCWEAKHIKGLNAFSFKRVEPHQDEYLQYYSEAEGIQTLLFIGFSVSRGNNRVYIIDYTDCGHDLYTYNFSIHKKFLEKLPYNEIHKERFEIKKVLKKEDFLQVYEKDNWNELLQIHGNL